MQANHISSISIVIVRWKSLLRIDYLLTFEAG